MQTDFHLRRSRCNAWTRCRALENRAAAAARLGVPARAALQADLLRLDAHHLLPAPSAALVAPVPQQRGAAGHDSSGGHVNSDDRTAGFDVEHLAASTQLPSSQQQGHGRQQEHQLCSASKSRDCSQAGSPANSRPSTPPHGQSTCCNLQPAGGLDTAAHLQDGTMKASAAVSDGSTAFLTSCRALALTVAAAELVGQVEAHCSQRGLALARLWNCQVQNNAGPLVLSFPSSPGSVPAAAPKARISFVGQMTSVHKSSMQVEQRECIVSRNVQRVRSARSKLSTLIAAANCLHSVDMAAEAAADLWGLREALAAQEALVLRGHADAAALAQLRRDAAGHQQVPSAAKPATARFQRRHVNMNRTCTSIAHVRIAAYLNISCRWQCRCEGTPREDCVPAHRLSYSLSSNFNVVIETHRILDITLLVKRNSTTNICAGAGSRQ